MAQDTLISFENLAAALNQYGAAVKEAYRKELDTRGKKASGNLEVKRSFSVVTDSVFGPTSVEVFIELPAYWFNVEYGRRPCPPSKHWVPVDALIKWIQVKPVIPYPDKNGRVPTVKQLAFLINRAINDPDRKGDNPKRPGIAPTPVLQSALDEVNRRYDSIIKAAVSKDMDVFLKSISFSDFSTRGSGRSNVAVGPHKRR